VARRGRRPGDQGTRESILAAARAVFIESGFTKATVTGVARRAEVDAALVYHYFGSKVDLFIEATAGPPHPGGAETRAEPHARGGVGIVAAFLQRWEQGPEQPGQAFVALAQAASSSPEAAASLFQFVTERIWAGIEDPDRTDDGQLSAEGARHASMVGSQLLGIAWARYIVKLEPLASAPVTEVASWFGPLIDSSRAT
jgi:AcrR family transcriptional regulator